MASVYSHLIKLYQLISIQNFAVEKKQLEKLLSAKKIKMTKFSAGVCCICSSNSGLKNIHHKYIYEDEIEDYIEMFQICFNVEMVDKNKQGDICESCIARLKDGFQFRKMVEIAAQNQQESVGCSAPKKTNEPSNWLNTGNETWRQKCGNRTTFCARVTKKPPLNIKPALPKETTICPVCNINFDTRFNLVRHHSSHYQNFVCSICGKGFYSKNNYKRHVSIHFNIRYNCNMCSKSYPHRDGLNQHKQIIHYKMKLYRCRKCPERFSASSTRQKHMFEKHGVDCRRFACAQCGKIFFTIQHHNSHVKRTHLHLKEYTCTLCSGAFHTERELNSHMVRHTGIGRFSCNDCGQNFRMRKSLIEHMKTHTSAAEYKCECGVDFTDLESLSIHLQTHHKDWTLLQSPNTEYDGQLFYITPNDAGS